MNPLPMVLADLRGLRATAWLILALIALATGLGVAVAAQERALRGASARAADDFDLLIGAPGSQTQLVLTTVYLQAEALPLIDGAILDKLAADGRVLAAAPIAFGDVVRGYPVVGTTQAFASRWGRYETGSAWGRVKLAEGRLFAAMGEAVIGADVAMQLGDALTPAHAVAGDAARPGVEGESEHAHRHDNTRYVVVGRLPRAGTPWDRAILVPIESVWTTHNLGTGHEAGPEHIGPPFAAGKTPGVPAIVVKPKGVADAYALRAQYRQNGTMALFPAEVLVSIYSTLGDIRDVLVVATALNALLVFTAILLLVVTIAGLRRRRYAVLRALGAGRLYIAAVVWLGAAALIGAGCALGLCLGWAAAQGIALVLSERTGLAFAVRPSWDDVSIVAVLALAGSVLAVVPGVLAQMKPVVRDLR